MSLASVVVLLQTALSLLVLVNSNPSLPQSMRDNAQQVAQQAIAQATDALNQKGTIAQVAAGSTKATDLVSIVKEWRKSAAYVECYWTHPTSSQWYQKESGSGLLAMPRATSLPAMRLRSPSRMTRARGLVRSRSASSTRSVRVSCTTVITTDSVANARRMSAVKPVLCQLEFNQPSNPRSRSGSSSNSCCNASHIGSQPHPRRDRGAGQVDI
jgi:hypothetical protein